MGKTGRKLLRWILPVVFVFSTGMLLRQGLDNAGAEQSYQEALVLAENHSDAEPGGEATTPPETQPREPQKIWLPAPVTEDPHMEDLSRINLESLRQVNPDVVGWIRIPDTKIDYPLLQGTDNNYYLKHTWDHKNNASGSIFLEQHCSQDLTDYNTILYGHNMNNGSMFAGLRLYRTREYLEKHPYVYLLTDAGVYRYEIFAAYRAPVDSITYSLNIQNEETKEAFLAYALENTQIQTDTLPAETDRVLTLSTCSGSGYSNRWVVQAFLKMVETEA